MRRRSFAKVNIFLKITGTREGYHTLASRFMRVNTLYDEIAFIKKESPSELFEIEGDFSCKTQNNSIYKAYNALVLKSKNPKIKHFFRDYKVKVVKNIPEFAGLGGGSSNAATFLLMANEALSLDLDKGELSSIGATIGADVPFFIYEYESANVSGIGEAVEPFDEEALDIDTFTPPIKCDTAKVYQRYRENYLSDNIDRGLIEELSKMRSKEILTKYDLKILNDLYEPACDLYPDLKRYHEEGWFFSGSGSTFFWILNPNLGSNHG